MKKYEKFDFLQKLEDYSVIFKAVYELGDAIYSNSIDTACVVKDNDKILFLINYDFFWKLNETERLFTICHESLHIFFKHLNKIESLKLNQKIANVAMDIINNETLIQHFNFNKNNITMYDKLCFIDTIFTPAEIKQYDLDLSKGFQYFYDILYKEVKTDNKHIIRKIKQSELADEHQPDLQKIQKELEQYNKNNIENESNSGNENNNDNDKKEDDESQMGKDSKPEQNSNDVNEINNNQNSQQSDDGDNSFDDKNKSNSSNINSSSENSNIGDDDNGMNNDSNLNYKSTESNYRPLNDTDIDDLLDEIKDITNKDITKLGDIIKDINGENRKHSNYHIDHYIEVDPNSIKMFKKREDKKWQKLVKFVNPSLLNEIETSQVSFANESLPFLFTMDDNMMLPGEKEDYEFGKSKINLYFFFDVSGSCINHQQKFLDIVSEIPTNLFNLHLFTFATKVNRIELDKKNKRFKKPLKVGGGTAFDIIEQQIQKDLSDRVIKKYPDLVCVLTDGWANPIKNIPEKKQKNWIWLIISGATNSDGSIDKSTMDILKCGFVTFIQENNKYQIIPFHDTDYNPLEPKVNKKIKNGCKIMPLYYLD